jgi:hypothetical protein
MTKIIHIFRNFANELKKSLIVCKKKIQTRQWIILEISRELLSGYNIRVHTKNTDVCVRKCGVISAVVNKGNLHIMNAC